MHLLGLVSTGGVHSHLDHLRALLELAQREQMEERTWIHAFTDGRDVSPHAAATDLASLPPERIATVVGRYYAMDRDNRAERTDRALAAILDGEGEQASDPVAAVLRELRTGRDRRVHRADRAERAAPPRSCLGRGDLLQLPPGPGSPARATPDRAGGRPDDDDAVRRGHPDACRLRRAGSARHPGRDAQRARRPSAPRRRDREVRTRHVFLQRGRGDGVARAKRGS